MQTAADLCGVSLRTWQYWESPASEQTIKPDVRKLLGDLLERKSELVAEFLASVGEDGDGAPVVLVRYRSQEELDRHRPGFPGGFGLHNAIIAALLEQLGERAVVQWAPLLGATARQQTDPSESK